jgi:hypothetical protein
MQGISTSSLSIDAQRRPSLAPRNLRDLDRPGVKVRTVVRLQKTPDNVAEVYAIGWLLAGDALWIFMRPVVVDSGFFTFTAPDAREQASSSSI